MRNIRVVHFGLGPIGAAIVHQIVSRPGLSSVGAIDIDPRKAGRDLGAVVGLPRRLGIRVEADPARVLKVARPDVVVHCTSSSLTRVMPELETVLGAGVSIVSTTEELAYPGRTHARQARRLHDRAKRAKAAVVGTGVNPGFAMDALPIMLTAACERVERVSVRRVQDARIRRLPFQKKIGAGLTPAQFSKMAKAGSVRHVGFAQSIAMIGDALGWTLDRISDTIQPKIADRRYESDFLEVEAGNVCGIIQDGVGFRRRKPVIALHLEAYLGSPESYDAVEIAGSPNLSMRISTGIHGDIGTASMVVNSIPRILSVSPGLHTMRDLPLPSFYPGR
jgi:4-hydroxy-tetrahydrodipicolinate reductase